MRLKRSHFEKLLITFNISYGFDSNLLGKMTEKRLKSKLQNRFRFQRFKRLKTRKTRQIHDPPFLGNFVNTFVLKLAEKPSKNQMKLKMKQDFKFFAEMSLKYAKNTVSFR